MTSTTAGNKGNGELNQFPTIQTTMEIFIKYELKNVAPRFHKAIWRKYSVMRGYTNAMNASYYHNLRNCCYEHRLNGITVATFNNAKIDAYGTRYR